MVGKYYWYEIAGATPHIAYIHIDWSKPDLVMAMSLATKQGELALGEYQLDEASGKLLEVGLQIASNDVSYGTAEATPTGFSDYTYMKDTAYRSTSALNRDGSIAEHNQKFVDGAWQDSSDATLVETSLEALQAAGLIKKKKK